MIQGLEKIVLADWSMGRHTSDNQATLPRNSLLVARNVIRQSGALKPMPGYQEILDTTLAQVQALFSFERQTDQMQFLIATGGTGIVRSAIDGSSPPVELSNTETSGDFGFIENAFACYMNNGAAAKKMINIAGVETLEPWGLQPASSPPSIAIGGAGLYLTYGTRYVYAEVFRWTDSLGTQRYHIGVPSDLSAHTGPLGLQVTDGVMNAGSHTLTSATAGFVAGDVGLQITVNGAAPNGGPLVTTISAFTNATTVTLTAAASTTVAGATVQFRTKAVTLSAFVAINPNTTHFWIFRVQDSPINASGTYYFVAEIPVATASYVDSSPDIDLDTTRQAPFDNYPPPLTNILIEYSGRCVALEGDTVSMSALNETPLGVAYESFPFYLQFIVPGGIKNLVAGLVFQQALLLATQDYWFEISGQDITTFQMLDQVVKPGCAGRKLALVVHGRLVWLGTDKKLWSWNGVVGNDPYPMSVALHGKSADQLNMDSLSPAFLSQCELRWFSNGTYDWIVLCGHVNSGTAMDWIQIWDLSPITGVLTIQGPIPMPAESDFFPYDNFQTSLTARDAGTDYMYFGSSTSGLVYRFPQGTDFNGEDIADAVIGTPWVRLSNDPAAGMSGRARTFFAKILTNIENAYQSFRMAAVASKGVDPSLTGQDLDLELDQDGNAVDYTVARANLNHYEQTAFGAWIKLFVSFPPDLDEDMALSAIEVSFKELPEV
jgi:hypothetical protein